MTEPLDSLFQPLQLGPLSLPNRIAMAPMTRSFSPNHVPGEDVAAYYRRRAEGGAALLITEGTYVGHKSTYADPSVPAFHGDAPLAGWKNVVDQVHAAGGRIMPQLWHVGIVTLRDDSLNGEPRYRPDLGLIGPSGILWPDEQVSEPMTQADIDAVIDAFAVAAVDARRLGFDGVELHGAHGYLIDQFFWDVTNRRTDGYGGSLRNRGRFAGEIIAEIRRRVGSDYPIILRISQWKQQDYAARLADTPEELAELLAPSVEAGVSMLHCSQRRFWEPAFDGSDRNLAAWVKTLTGVPTMSVGSVGLDVEFLASLVSGKQAKPASLQDLARMMDRGDFDMVAVGRGLLSDPAWANKVAKGDLESLRAFDASSLATLY